VERKYGSFIWNSAVIPEEKETNFPSRHLFRYGDFPISPLAEKTTMKSAFCMLVGELMYIAINTRPEISITHQSFHHLDLSTHCRYDNYHIVLWVHGDTWFTYLSYFYLCKLCILSGVLYLEIY
jgi:hypothetical protein